MICPNCQTNNPESAKFCIHCGKPLEKICPRCAASNPVGAAFCQNCGNSLNVENQPAPTQESIGSTARSTAPRPAVGAEGERRVMTILFCDVTDSTAMAESMDPEEWTGIMNQMFPILIEPVNRYSGTVARLMGDAILAFFGAPLAHEDDPQRAVLAGLEILSGVQKFSEKIKVNYGFNLNVRVGINTGLVVVGKVGNDQRAEYTAMGDAVNLAARMEQTAKPGTIQVSADTHKFIAPLFDFQPLGEIEIKGKREPVAVYQVLGKKEGALPTRGIQGLRSPLVGRELEFGSLKDCVERLMAGQGQIVSLMGEAGLGKSRLAAELRSWMKQSELLREGKGDANAPLLWLEGRTLAYQSSIPYAPFKDLLGHYFQAFPGSGDGKALRDYTAFQAQVKKSFPGPNNIASYLATLMDIPVTGEDAELVQYLSPPQLRERIFQAVLDWARGLLSGGQKVGLVLEDLHWADSTSLELIARLMDLTADHPFLLLALFRPNSQDPSWQYHELGEQTYPQHYTVVTLRPLDEGQSRTLVANLLAIEDLPEKVRNLILRKAEGNPFFVEEVIRSLLDEGWVVREGGHWRAKREIDSISIPNTLVGVITARLDQLDEATRRVAQEAAVIGREFGLEVLEKVHNGADAGGELAAALDRLQQRELIRERKESRGGQPVFSFKHVLVQETAYASLLLSQRKNLHLRVATFLVEARPEQFSEIARHFLEAHEAVRALPYLVQAGEQAARTYATQEAIPLFTQALEIAKQARNAELVRRAAEGLGRALTFANRVQEASDAYQAMYAWGEEIRDIPIQVSALNKLSDLIAMRLGQFPEAEKLLRNAERLARDFNDRPGLAELFMIRCGLCTAAGDFHGAVSYLGESVQIAQSMDRKADVALGLTHIANTQVWMTEFQRAWETAQRSLQISREIGNLELQAETLAQSLPLYHMRQGDYERAYQAAEEGAQIAARIGASFPESMGSYFAGRLADEMGDYETALTWEKKAARAGKAFGMPFLSSIAQCTLGMILQEISETLRDQVVDAHTQVLKTMELPGGTIGAGVIWADLGFCALALGDLSHAMDYFHKGLEIPNPQMLVMRPRFLIGLALVSLAADGGDVKAAEAYLEQARAFAVEKGMRNYEPEINLAEGKILLQKGDLSLALEHFAQAERQAMDMKRRPLVWQARDLAARTLLDLGQEKAAKVKREQAREMIAEIGSLFQDETYRQSYLINTAEKMS